MDETAEADWPTFYGVRRLAPTLRVAADRAALDPGAVSLVERVIADLPRLAGPAEPPARLHGDLWSGNVHWAADGRAMLALFGVPHLDRIRAAYDETAPLADGWPERVTHRVDNVASRRHSAETSTNLTQ